VNGGTSLVGGKKKKGVLAKESEAASYAKGTCGKKGLVLRCQWKKWGENKKKVRRKERLPFL